MVDREVFRGASGHSSRIITSSPPPGILELREGEREMANAWDGLEFGRYRKLPREVTAEPLTEPLQLDHPFAKNGGYRGRPGDWLVTYSEPGEEPVDQAVVDREIFEETYEQVGPGRYQKKPDVIRAAQLTESMDVETLEGPAHGEPGDWLLLGVRDEPYFNTDATFRKSYRPAQ
jgi:hypothetical protein